MRFTPSGQLGEILDMFLRNNTNSFIMKQSLEFQYRSMHTCSSTASRKSHQRRHPVMCNAHSLMIIRAGVLRRQLYAEHRSFEPSRVEFDIYFHVN